MIRQLVRDAVELARVSSGDISPSSVAKAALLQDSYTVLALSRMRNSARKWHLLGANRLMRLVQTGVFGIEIGKDVQLGDGVWFVHTLGIILGGDSRIGQRVRFMGNNTIGTAKNDGYPTIEDDVVVGAGARILGPVRIGARSVIGANAVVVSDVPPDSVAVGIPATVRPKRRHPPVMAVEPEAKPAKNADG